MTSGSCEEHFMPLKRSSQTLCFQGPFSRSHRLHIFEAFSLWCVMAYTISALCL